MITFTNGSTNTVRLFDYGTSAEAFMEPGVVLVVPSGTWGVERGSVSNGVNVGTTRQATVAIGQTTEWTQDEMTPGAAFAKGFGWMAVICATTMLWRMWQVGMRGDS